MSQFAIQNLKRLRALLLTLSLVIVTNFAISFAISSEKSGIATMPNNPRPKAGVATMPNNPRPKAGVATMPNNPRP